MIVVTTRTLLPTGAVVATAAAVGVYALASGPRRSADTAATYPGAFTSVAEAVGTLTAILLAALCLGAVLYVVITARPDRRQVIDAPAFRVHLLAERVSIAWLVVALVMVPVQAAGDAGADVMSLVTSPVLFEAIRAFEPASAWIVTAVCAAVTAIVLRVSLRWVAHCVLLLPTVVGVVAVQVTGNAGQGHAHDYATSAAIVFWPAVSALVGLAVARLVSPPDAVMRRRVNVAQAVAASTAVGYGAVLAWLLLGPSGFTGSDYGRLSLVAAVLLLGICGALVLQAERRTAHTDTAVATMSVALTGVLAAMGIQAAPELLAHPSTSWDVFLGYELTEPPNAIALLTFWRFDLFLGIVALALAAAYVAGYLRLRRRGDAWPVGRLVSWLLGCFALVFATGSGLRSYGSAMFSVHMAEHMALNMFIPVLLVLGAPITLALRALPAAGNGEPPGPREWITTLVHSRVNAVIAHPATAFVLFVGSVYAVYFTPLFDVLVRYHWGHELMSIHFLLTGYLFFWVIIGVDPGPRRLPFLARLGLLFAVMPFHAFFGIATMTMTSVIGDRFYLSLDLPWLESLRDDQHLGGAIAWGSSEVPVIIVVVVLVAQWARQDRRAGARGDRHADSDYGDDELDAYNAMLRELAKSRR